jgi:hypothetical protein
MIIRDTGQAARIAAMVEAKRRLSRSRERNGTEAYNRGRTDMAAEILREIEGGEW